MKPSKKINLDLFSDEAWYTVQEVALCLKLSSKSVYLMAQDGELPAHQRKRRASLRFHGKALNEYLHRRHEC